MVTIREERPLSATEHDLDPGRSRPGFFLLAMAAFAPLVDGPPLPAELVRVGLDGSGKIILRRRIQRKAIVALTSKLSLCIIAMEACCGAHHLGRVLSVQGHTLRLMSPEYVQPYVKAQKNDD